MAERSILVGSQGPRQKFLPRDGLTHFDAVKDLSEVIMEGDEDPIEFYERLLNTQFQYEHVLTNRELQSQFLRGCATKYNPSILQIYRDQPNINTEELALKLQIDYRLSGALDSQLAIDNESIEHETVLTQSERGPPARGNATAPTRSTKSDTDKICHLCGRGSVMRNCPNTASRPPLKCELCNRFGHPRAFCWEDEANAHRRPEDWRSILPAPKTEDDDANLVSYTFVSHKVNFELNNDELNDNETGEEALCPTYTSMQNKNENKNDDDIDSNVLVEPLPSEAAAYADPSVYTTPEKGTSERDAIIVDSSDETMSFVYHTDGDESFYSADDTSEDHSTYDDMISITGELDRLSPAFCVEEGTK